VGTNNLPVNTSDEIALGVSKVIETIKGRLPGTRVLLLGILPRGPQKGMPVDGAGPCYTEKVTATNAQLAKLADGQTVHYIDIGPQFIGADGGIISSDMPDGLHLVEPGYRKWAASIDGVIERLMESG
jgi:lysophospholipase L1-like esterase